MNKKNNNGVVMNEDIVADTIRCIDANGDQLGIISLQEGLDRAYSQNLDLVLISNQNAPYVCKIIDYGKYKYKQEKKKKESRKNQKIIDIKELKLSIKIADHDLNIKMKRAREFINAGKYVRFKIQMRGRENMHPELALEVLKRAIAEMEDIGSIENSPKLEGKSYTTLIVPKK